MREPINTICRCKLCGKMFPESQMSEEHYPAKSVGNIDLVGFDVVKLFDFISFKDSSFPVDLDIKDLENDVMKSSFPKGRTIRSLCKNCNTLLGKYDASYLKFFRCDGNPNLIKGYQQKTKTEIIKAIYGKFISLPEAEDEEFDFKDYLLNESNTDYNGIWKIFYIARDITSDFLGLPDLSTGKLEFNEGTLYEFSDEKFIFDIMNFDIHSCFNMTPLFDIYKNDYIIVQGLGNDGGYHAQILISNLFNEAGR